MHLWPRENFFLQAQPNKGGGYTVALFMPLCENNDSLIFRYLPPRHQIRAFFEEQFPDIAEYLPSVVRDTYDARPAQLRTVRCDPFHHGRTVLLGDAAHTIVPFYGQGINCSFEDISTLASMFDECRLASGSASRGMARAIKRFSEIRVDPDHAIADLSLSNLHELSSASADERFQQRKAIEVRLAREDPDHFRTLYEMVAFTSLPYHRVIERDHLQAALLDELCSRHDLARDAELIAREYTLAIRAALSGRHTLRQRVLGRSVPDPAVDLARALLTDAVGLTDQRAVDDTVVTTRRHGVAPAGHAARPAR